MYHLEDMLTLSGHCVGTCFDYDCRNVSLNGNLTVNPMLFSNKFHAFRCVGNCHPSSIWGPSTIVAKTVLQNWCFSQIKLMGLLFCFSLPVKETFSCYVIWQEIMGCWHSWMIGFLSRGLSEDFIILCAYSSSFLETKSDAVTTTTAVPQIAPIPAPKHDAASTPAHRHVPPPVAHQFVPTPPPAPWKHAPRPAPPPRPAPTSPAPTPAPTPAPPTPPPALNKTPKHPPPPPTRVAPTPSRTPATTPAATPAPTFHDFNLGGPTLGKLGDQLWPSFLHCLQNTWI